MDDGLCTCSSGFYKQLVRLMFQDRLYFQISDDVVFILVFARRSAHKSAFNTVGASDVSHCF